MFARLEESHVGELPAAITSGLGGSERREGGSLFHSQDKIMMDPQGIEMRQARPRKQGLRSGNGFQVLR